MQTSKGYSHYIDKFQYYRETQLWPLNDKLNYEHWLDNFTSDQEKEVAFRLLDYLIYIPEKFVNQMLKTVIGHCGYILKDIRGTWAKDDFNRNCFYSFIPGEDENPTDSGFLFQRKLRDYVGISERQIKSYRQILDIMAANDHCNIILIDDFVGSGAQTYTAWNKNVKVNGNHTTMSALCKLHNHCVIYAPLIVNQPGFDTITSKCDGLRLTFVHKLGDQSNLLSPNCPCWEGDLNLYNKALPMLMKKSKELHIPITSGHSVNDVFGFGGQGLALAFEHGMPDACLPIFYWETESWKPLVKKHFSRS